MSPTPRPVPTVVQYLYVHGPQEAYDYPSSRAGAGSGRLAERYLECVLVQAASLRLRGPASRQLLVSNVRDRRAVGRRGARLLREIEALGVEMLHADYDHRPVQETAMFASSRYVLDAILAATALLEPDSQLWLTDVDCVWLDAARVFAAAPAPPALGCVHIPYPLDWNVNGSSRAALREIVAALGRPEADIEWVGGELLGGRAGDLRALVASCEQLEPEITAAGFAVATEEQLLTVAAGLGRVPFEDLCPVARRIWTGPRHGAPPVEEPEALGLWHLPSEKGLGFRRSARELAAGRRGSFLEDLADPRRAMARFNIGGGGLRRRIRDDAWLSGQRLLARLPVLRR